MMGDRPAPDQQTDHTADGAIINPSFAYGINTKCINNLHYLEEQRLLYPAGQFLVSLSADDGKSTFIPSAASVQAVKLLQVSANKRYLAAAELPHDSEQQQVSVYNAPAQKREQTLQLASHTRSNTVIALSFSGDTKLLCTLSGEPGWTVLLWRWQQAKVVLEVHPEYPCVGACLSLWDDSLLAVAGLHAVKAYRFDVRTGTTKSSNAMMLDSHKAMTVTCLCHLVGGMLAVGTSSGRIMICSPTGVLSVHDIAPPGSIQESASLAGGAVPTARADCSTPTGSKSRSVSGAAYSLSGLNSPSSAAGTPKSRKPSLIAPWQQDVVKEVGKFGQPAAAAGQYAVQAVVQRGRGFVAAGSMGDVYLFNPAGTAGGRGAGNTDAFCVSHKFHFAGQPSSSLCGTLTGGGGSSSGQAHAFAGSTEASSTAALGDSGPFSSLAPALRVCGLTVSPTDEQIAVATAAGKLMVLNIAAAVEAREEAASTAGAVPADGPRSQCGSVDGATVGAEPGAAMGVALDALAGESHEEQPPEWQVVASGFPTARVVGLDAVTHLPLLLVASEDGWVRVYDWMRRTRLAARHMGSRQALSCSLHPSGLIAAVGTSEALAVYWVLKASLSPMAELPVVKCNVSRYSHTGGLLAAAGSSNTIYVYPAYYGYEGAAGRPSNISTRAPGHSHSAAVGGGDGSAVLEAVVVLKGHVSTVTDLVFSGDDKWLISTGAGGAVYFWELSTGTRLIELEYVDKKCVYCSACFSDHHGAAVVRTMDGRLQHIKDGQLVYEASGLAQDCCPMAMTGDGRVCLAATSTGSVISIGWPRHPEAPAADADADADFDGMLSFSGAARPAPASPGAKPGPMQYKHLSVQVGAGSALSPKDHNAKSGDSTPRTAGVHIPARGAHGQASSPAVPKGSMPGAGENSGQAAEGSLGPGSHDYKLHAGRITAIKILHHAGIMFTASADGLVLMSSLTLVLDGVLIDPPPPTLPMSATAQGNSWAQGSMTLTATQQGPAGLPPAVVLVDDGVILGMHDRIKRLQHKMATMHREAQYQVLRQTQGLKESLSSSHSHAASLAAEVERLRVELEQCRQKAVTDQEQILKELEGLHLSAAEQLEGLYEARLALEKERLRHMAAAKDDLELSLKEEMKRLKAAAAKELAEVHEMYQQQLASEASRTEAAAAAAAEADAVWQEVLMQTEEDLEKRAETDSERLATLQRTAEETQVKLRAEANILSRSNERLKAEKTADAARMAALQQEVKALQQQLADAGAVADKLRAEIGERDGVIGDNYGTMQGLRRRVQELETHKFVLTYKNEATAAELQPKEEQLEHMQATVHAQDKELLAGRSALLAAQRAVAERSAAISQAKQELWEAKRKTAHQSALLDAIAHDIAHVLQQPDERVPGGTTASKQALEKLAVKYCTKRGGGARTSVQVEAEMMAHIAAAEKKSNILERQLNQARADKQQHSRRLMADNSHLLADLAELQHSTRELAHKLATATRQLAALQLQQEAADSVAPGAAGSRPSSGRPPSLQQGGTLALQKVGRSQGVRMGGTLALATEGGYFAAEMQQQWSQIAELQATLDTMTGVVQLQAAQLARMQEHVDITQEQAADADSADDAKQRSPAAGSPSAGRGASPLGATLPRTAGGTSRPSSASPSRFEASGRMSALRTPSPAGSLSDRRPTSSHHGMIASMKSDLEAWRAK